MFQIIIVGVVMNFTKKNWFIILLCVLFPPAGLILMWMFKKEWNKFFKIVLTIILSFWFLIICVGFFSPDTQNNDSNTNSVITSDASQDIKDEESGTDFGILPSDSEDNIVHSEPSSTTTSEISSSVDNQKENSTNPTTSKPVSTTSKPTTTNPTTSKPVPTTTKPETTQRQETTTVNPDLKVVVYVTKTGKKYHYENPCGNGTYYESNLADAKARGLQPCEKCVLH